MKLTFEEDFQKEFYPKDRLGNYEYIDITDKEVEDFYNEQIKWLNKHCLDKQRVRDAIDKILATKYPLGIIFNYELKKELGLDGEEK